MRATGMAIVLAILAGASWAAPASPPVDRDKIARLVEQLESGSPRERESAMEQLEAVGEPALERLRIAEKSLHPRAAARAMKVVEAIGRRARDARLLAPTVVELDLDNATVDEAIAELSRQSGYEVIQAKSANGDRRVTLKTGRVPFLRALEVLEERAGLVEKLPPILLTLPDELGAKPEPYPQPIPMAGYGDARRFADPNVAASLDDLPRHRPTVFLEAGKSERAPSQVGSAIRVRFGPSLLTPENTRLAGSPLFLRVDSEPKITLRGIASIRIDRAIDDRGQDRVRVRTHDGDRPVPFWHPESTPHSRALLHLERQVFDVTDDNWSLHYPLAFRPAEKPAKSLREVSGVVRINVDIPVGDLAVVDRLTEKGRGTRELKTGGTIALRGIARNRNGSLTVWTEQRYEKGLTPESDRDLWWFGEAEIEVEGKRRTIPLLAQTHRLFDDRGRELQKLGPTEMMIRSEPGGLVQMQNTCFRPADPDSKPASFVVSGASVETIEVPFVLKDVPLQE